MGTRLPIRCATITSLATSVLAFSFLARPPSAWALGDCEGHPACCTETCDDTCCLASTQGASFCPCGDGTCIDSCGGCDAACMKNDHGPPVQTGVCGSKSIDDAHILAVLKAAGQKPGPLLGGQTTVPIDTHFGGDVDWHLNLRITDSDGISVEDIRLDNRVMAKRIRAPYFKVRLAGPPLSRCELKTGNVDACDRPLDDFWGKGKVRLVAFEVANGKAGASGQVPTLNIRASYEIDPASVPEGSDVACLYVTQDYAFSDQDPAGCEPSNGLPCWRFYPTISFRYFAHAGDPTVLHMRMPQEMVFTPSGTSRGGQTFLSDGRLNVPTFSNPFTSPQPFIGITDPYLGNPLPVESHLVVVRDAQPVEQPSLAPWQGLGFWRSVDNMHQSCASEVVGPGAFFFKLSKVNCSLFLFRAGCPECVHMHWNWTYINSLVAAAELGGCPKEAQQYNFGNPLVPAGSKQDIEIAEVVRREGEADPPDYRDLANGEPLVHPHPDGLDAEKTFWYEGVTTATTDSFNIHGGFFNPIGPKGGIFGNGNPGCEQDVQRRMETQGLLPIGVVGLTPLLLLGLGTKRRRRAARFLALLLLAGVSACGQKNATTPSQGTVEPLPDTLFRGRGRVLTVTGSQVAITPETIAVENVHETSPGVTEFTARVAVEEPAEAAELVVDGKPAATLAIADALTLVGPPAHLEQSRTTTLHVVNHDLQVADWDHAPHVTADPAVQGGVRMANGQDVELGLYALPNAPPGPRDVRVMMGGHLDPLGAQAIVHGAIIVDERVATPLQSGVDGTATVPAGQAGTTWAMPGAAGKLVDVRMPAPLPGALRSVLEIQDPNQGLLHPQHVTLGPELVGLADPALDPQVFVGLLDGPRPDDTPATVRADVMDPILANEAADHGTPAQAQMLALPTLVQASLSTALEVDWYRVEVPAGTLVVRTFGLAGQAGLDTEVQVLDANQAVLGQNDDESPNDAGSLVLAPVQAGPALIRVARGLDGYREAGEYRLVAFVR